MGAKYVPTVANIFTSKWEAEEIYGRPRQELKMYKRYIDNKYISNLGRFRGQIKKIPP